MFGLMRTKLESIHLYPTAVVLLLHAMAKCKRNLIVRYLFEVYI